jgi:hypothetical protein
MLTNALGSCYYKTKNEIKTKKLSLKKITKLVIFSPNFKFEDKIHKINNLFF